MVFHRSLTRIASSIGTKIILPYLLLTLVVASAGAFIVVNLVTSSLQERFDNQLLDAGRIVAESMVGYEQQRLQVLRLVKHTAGVAEGLAASDHQALAALVPQIIANSDMDAVTLLDSRGVEIYGWQRLPGQPEGETYAGADLSRLEDVRFVLDGYVDELGSERALLAQTPGGTMLFTIGPVYLGKEVVGAAMVGTDVRKMVVTLTQQAIARVTLYDQNGMVMATTLGHDQQDMAGLLREPPAQYESVIQLLQESPEKYRVVAATAENQVPLRQVNVLNQTYQLAYGDWRLRNHSFGLFSVALPSNFIVSAAVTSRNLLNLVFSLATAAVFTIGFVVAQRIVQPLNRLVQIATAVAKGNLEQNTGIRRGDEIGALAQSFDTMTVRLAERNRQLVEQASELAAILDSIADSVIVLDAGNHVVKSNPAARELLTDLSCDFSTGRLPEFIAPGANEPEAGQEMLPGGKQPRRYDVGHRVLSALSAPVQTPEGKQVGTVMVLRDITREAEAENLKDAFITGVSHELRTPLTVAKLYTDLILKSANGHLGEKELTFLRKIEKSTQELDQHIEKLINITELQAGTMHLEKASAHFPDLVRNITEEWRERLESKGLIFAVQFCAEDCYVEADARHLSWAIENLISNAYSYTGAGGCVQVHVFKKDNEARLDVIDNGIGIATADQPHLFERFFRANNEVNFGARGIGLGLFITRSIVELHGGRIWVRSRLGAGSTFSCAIPLIVRTG